MRRIAGFLVGVGVLVGVAVAAPVAGETIKLDAGEIASGKSYGEVRETLIDSGWLATGPCDDDGAGTCNPAYPEMQACAGTGTAPCKFRWTRGEYVKTPAAGKAIIVITEGEQGKTVTSVSVEN